MSTHNMFFSGEISKYVKLLQMYHQIFHHNKSSDILLKDKATLAKNIFERSLQTMHSDANLIKTG